MDSVKKTRSDRVDFPRPAVALVLLLFQDQVVVQPRILSTEKGYEAGIDTGLSAQTPWLTLIHPCRSHLLKWLLRLTPAAAYFHRSIDPLRASASQTISFS